ncbi:MAG TPA: YihY/virulence factor BrkB family protein [Bacteroidota bacterium]|nr:YihY/virulence factor BrkB family protein [Bacteroidota bacterium]
MPPLPQTRGHFHPVLAARTLAQTAWYYVRSTARRTKEADILFLASGLAFNGIFALIPIMLLLASAIGVYFNSSSLGVQHLQDILHAVFPPQPFAQQIQNSILDIVSDIVVYRTSLGVFGVVVLVWTVTSLFDAVRSVLHQVYALKRTKGLMKSLLHDLGFVVLAFVFFIAINLATWVSSLAEHVMKEIPALSGLSMPQLNTYLPTTVVVALSAIMFYILYRYITDEKPPNAAAIVSTVTSTVIWVVSGKLFSVYLTSISNIATVYGSYTFLVVLLFWIYFTSLIFVFGGIVGQVHWERLRFLHAQSIQRDNVV